MTQTREKLACKGIRNQAQAIYTHEQVCNEVRDAIARRRQNFELMPLADHMKEVAKRLKEAMPKLKLDECMAAIFCVAFLRTQEMLSRD